MIHVLLEFALCALIGGAAAGVLGLMVLAGFMVWVGTFVFPAGRGHDP